MGVWSEFCGSMKTAKERPICRPIMSPASVTAAKASCMASPSAMPAITCCMMRSTPVADSGDTAAIAGSVGATRIVSSTASPMRTGTGTLWCDSSGAEVISASMRMRGYRKAVNQASTSAALMLITGPSTDHVRDAGVEALHVIGEQRKYPRTRDDHHREDRQQLRDEGQGC